MADAHRAAGAVGAALDARPIFRATITVIYGGFMRISKEKYEQLTSQVKQVMTFLDVQFPKLNREQWQQSYQSWARGGNGWNRYSLGGTYINGALAWYQHIHKPGSKEWRPSIIMAAVLQAAQQSGAQQ